MEDLIRAFLDPGSGSGSGYGDGSGYVSGYVDGYGYGSGYVDGSGYGVKSFDGRAVHRVDGVQTLIYAVRGNIAKGAILRSDLTLEPCWIFKQDGHFAHGETLHAARDAVMEKVMEAAPEEERLAAFVKSHSSGKVYPNTDFFSWHHRLTLSCEMGRREFAADHNIDVEHGSMTPEEFIRLTEHAYGGRIIQKLRPFYGIQAKS